MLDGVFNHTGSQSRYFKMSTDFIPLRVRRKVRKAPISAGFPYHPWPEDYDSWWGIRTLPAVREEDESYVNYIIQDPQSIIRRWLRAGVSPAGGWTWPMNCRTGSLNNCGPQPAETDPEAFVLGEVWEDASNKVAYHQRRRYLLGRELHGVMNYPFRTALLDYLRGGDAAAFAESMETLRERYPPAAFYSAMNFLGTHDTPRILTVLGAANPPAEKADRASFLLSPQERQRGIALLKLAALILFTFPGSPTIYYGDEAGMESWEDPLNRGTYPWGQEDSALLAYFTLLGRQRTQLPALQRGAICYQLAEGPPAGLHPNTGRERLPDGSQCLCIAAEGRRSLGTGVLRKIFCRDGGFLWNTTGCPFSWLPMKGCS